jgi:flagellar motor component MotA
MRQSRLMSLVEAIANVVVGMIVAVATQIVAFPTLGVQASLGQNVRLALVFTIVSIGRSFLLRRLFEAAVMRSREFRVMATRVLLLAWR